MLIPGQYIVRYRASALDWQTRIQSATVTKGAVIQGYYSTVFNGAVIRIADSLAHSLLADPNVVAVEQDQIVSMATTQSNATWGIDRIDQRSRPLDQKYNYSSGGAGVTVYIVDTGIDFSQGDFQGRVSTGMDMITPGGSGADCNGHGTHVAGTVGSATYGVAKQVNMKAVRVLDCTGHGPLSGVVAAVDWITAHASRPAVVNMSITGALSAALNASLEASVSSGITYAVAAGNNAADACTASPSSAPNALTVGATDASDAFGSFSNFGACVDILAPGVNITSLWLGNGSATVLTGTSMASPHVAGAAALYLQVNPAAAPAQVRAALVGNATMNAASAVPAATANLLLYTGFLTPQPAPVASFTSSCTFLSCNFNASASTALSNATYTWNFGDGASGTGITANHLYAAGGTYTVTLTIADVNGTTSKSATVTIGGNQPPMAIISLPTAGTYTRGMSGTVAVAFSGTANDPETGLLPGGALAWTSSRDGQIGTGTSFSKSNLTLGTHIISLIATDPLGLADTATTTITIAPVVMPLPVAVITAPAPNDNFTQGASVLFAGTGTDSEQGALTGTALVWTSSRDGQIGTGVTFTKSNLSVGQHTITLSARNKHGFAGTTTVSITIGTHTNLPPTASITTPTPNSTVVVGTSVTFTGTGSDPESGSLSGASLVWTSSRDGQIGTGTSFSRSNLSLGTHTITLTATDPQGATGTMATTLTVVPPPNQPPTTAITLPAPGSTAVLGTSVSFAGSGNDPETGAMSGASLVWRSNRDGQIGSGTAFSRTNLTLGAHTITLTATDAQGATAVATTTVTIVPPPNQPPTVSIISPATTTAFLGASVSFSGSAADPETGPLSGASLVWKSSQDGQIGTGTSFQSSSLTLGTHTITLTATDAQGATGTATTTLTVVPRPNQPPTAQITAPVTGGTFVAGASVSFAGSGTDPEQGALTGASLVWTSSKDGQIGIGTSFARTNLTVGVHLITLKATDGQGANHSATATITIVAPNQPPTASISSPAAGSFAQGAVVTFAGSGNDPESGALAGAALTWASSLDGVIGTGASFSVPDLSVGSHTVTLTAKDPQGATGKATVVITIVAPNQPPTVSISSPVTGSSYPQGTSIAFAGSASDPETGPLTGASLVWTSNLHGQIGTGGSFSSTTLIAGTHIITLTATDAHGAVATATRTITVTTLSNQNQPPVAAFTFVCGPTISATPHTCALNGSISTDDGGVRLWTWNLGNGSTTSKKTPISNFTWATAGTYWVTLTVSDAAGLTSSIGQSVVVP